MLKGATSLLLLAGVLATPSQAHAFAEDTCVRSVRSGLKNCMDSNCDEHGDSAACRANVLIDGGVTTLIRDGRSLYHTDATYLLAQAAGFSPEAAYWIAAYDQAADSVVYKPFDRCGDALENQDSLSTLPLRGFNRNSVGAGGTGFHLPVPYRPNGFEGPLPVDGLHPNLEDSTHEGMLYHVRVWAQDGQLLCVNGLTEGGDSIFTGDSCYEPPEVAADEGSKDTTEKKDNKTKAEKKEDKKAEKEDKKRPPPGSIRYELSTLSVMDADVPFTAMAGRQMAEFDPNLLSFKDRSDIILARNLDTYLARGKGRLNGEPVPSELVRLGVYLHMLQDRISHHACGDMSDMTGPDDQGSFQVSYKGDACGQDYHALYHFQETSQVTLPPRSDSALNMSLDELKGFASLWGEANPGWMNPEVSVDGDALVEAILTALKVEKAGDRVDALTKVAKEFKLAPLPGHGEEKRCGIF